MSTLAWVALAALLVLLGWYFLRPSATASPVAEQAAQAEPQGINPSWASLPMSGSSGPSWSFSALFS